MTANISLDIEVKSQEWHEINEPHKLVSDLINKILPQTELRDILHQDIELELAISLVSNSQIQEINNEFRGKNKATNVLSFPSLDHQLIATKGLLNLLKDQQYIFLGDIVIAYDYLKEEAKNQDKTFNDHLTHLLLHSILHLIGFDHEQENQANIMESLEIKILKTLNIQNPYQ